MNFWLAHFWRSSSLVECQCWIQNHLELSAYMNTSNIKVCSCMQILQRSCSTVLEIPCTNFGKFFFRNRKLFGLQPALLPEIPLLGAWWTDYTCSLAHIKWEWWAHLDNGFSVIVPYGLVIMVSQKSNSQVLLLHEDCELQSVQPGLCFDVFRMLLVVLLCYRLLWLGLIQICILSALKKPCLVSFRISDC